MENFENEKYDSILGAETIYNYALKIEEDYVEYKKNNDIPDIDAFNKKIDRIRELQSPGSELTEEQFDQMYSELLEYSISLEFAHVN